MDTFPKLLVRMDMSRSSAPRSDSISSLCCCQCSNTSRVEPSGKDLSGNMSEWGRCPTAGATDQTGCEADVRPAKHDNEKANESNVSVISDLGHPRRLKAP